MHLRNVNLIMLLLNVTTHVYLETQCTHLAGAVGVSAFAFMGSNVHVIILSEYLGPDVTKRSHILPWGQDPCVERGRTK